MSGLRADLMADKSDEKYSEEEIKKTKEIIINV